MKRLKWVFPILLVTLFSVWFFFPTQATRNQGCPFCNRQILDEQQIYRGEHASLILTHKPSTVGHSLIIPHRHVERFELLSPEEVIEISELVVKVQKAVEKAYGFREYALVQKNGTGVGQSVPHLHLHFIPKDPAISQTRYIFRFFLSPLLSPLSKEEKQERASTLIEALS